jgi:hypothetical protein
VRGFTWRVTVPAALLALGAGCSEDPPGLVRDASREESGAGMDADAGAAREDATVIDADLDGPDDAATDADSMRGDGTDDGATRADAAGDVTDLYAPEAGAGCEAGAPATCTPRETRCAAAEVCFDGLDNNCNRSVDEGCPCLPGTVQTCFAGPPGLRAVGACADGTQRCMGSGEFGSWGPCTGGISPSAESCDMLDNDCDGCRDEGLCCGGDLTCPGPGDPRIPTARPFEMVRIDGASFFRGAARAWRWEIRGGPCESVLPTPTFTTGSLTASTLQFTPSLSGDYTVTLRVTEMDGTERVCTFIVHVAGEGLRVELCWRPAMGTASISDLDLYLHEPDTMTPWFSRIGPVTSSGITLGNSCNWANCGPGLRGLPRASWGYANSPLDRCVDGPGGAVWRTLGACPNPRIDVDGHGSASEPRHGYIENINADNPRDGQRFRVLVHDCAGPATTPLVNVYCGGFLRATLGAAPETVTLPGGASCSSNDTLWRVADVSVNVNAMGVTTGCAVTPLRATGGGPRLTRGDLSF